MHPFFYWLNMLLDTLFRSYHMNIWNQIKEIILANSGVTALLTFQGNNNGLWCSLMVNIDKSSFFSGKGLPWGKPISDARQNISLGYLVLQYWQTDILQQLELLLLIVVTTVTPVLRDHCQEGPAVLKDQLFLSKGSAFQCIWTCHQRPPVLRDRICMANGMVFQDSLYCTGNIIYKDHPRVYTVTQISQVLI